MKESKELGKLESKKVVQSGMGDAAMFLEYLDNQKQKKPDGSCISQRVHVPMDRIESAISFWKPIYFGVTAENRLLSGIEAYDLGDEKHQIHPDKGPYIAMCNLMALEAFKLMGDNWPTVEKPELMAAGTDREKLVAEFWKKTFSPTLFQVGWAWSAVMAVMAGDPMATREILYDYKQQLP